MGNNKYTYQDAAAEAAAEAGNAALDGRLHRNLARLKAFALDACQRIMANASPLKATIIAGVLALLNLFTSWEMNWDLLDQTGVFQTFGWDKPPAWSPLIIALPLEALAFYAAYWLGKAYFADLFEWHVWNRQHIVHNGQYLRAQAVAEELKHRQKARLICWILLGFVVVIQGGISAHRIQVTDDNPVAVLLAVLAFVFLLGEVLAGVYFDFLLKKGALARAMRRHQATFRDAMRRCAAADRMVYQLLEKARENGESFEPNGDMKRALYRYKRRSLDSEDYVDDVNLRRATFEVTGADNRPAVNIRVVGQLENGRSTDASFTSETGATIVYWDSREEALVSIRLNDVEIPGPFSQEQVHRLRLSLGAGSQPASLEP